MVYFLGYDGYGIYDITNDNLRLYNNSNLYVNPHLITQINYNQPPKIYHLHDYNDFSVSEQQNFATMIQDENQLKPISNYGTFSSDRNLIDLDAMLVISNLRNYVVKNKDIYLYNGSYIMKVDSVNKIITYCHNSKLGPEATDDSKIISKVRAIYKSKFIELNSIHDFSNEDITIFEDLRNKALEAYRGSDSVDKYKDIDIHQLQ